LRDVFGRRGGLSFLGRHFLAPAAANDMDMGAAGFFVEAGYKEFLAVQACFTDGAGAGAVSFQAEDAAKDVHHPFRPAHGGKGRRFDPLAFYQLYAAYRAGAGRAGDAGFRVFAASGAAFAAGHGGAAGDGKKQGKAKPQEQYRRQGKKEYLE